MPPTHHQLLQLLQVAISGQPHEGIARKVDDWKALFNLSIDQGVRGLVWQGIELQKRAGLLDVPLTTMLEWYGSVQQLEKLVSRLHNLSREFAEGLQPYPCLVLKGIDYSRYWPIPLHREFGDLDFYSGDDFDATNAKAKQMGAEVEDGGYKHSHIHYKGLPVENHRFFTQFNGTTQGYRTEQLLKSVLQTPFAPIEGTAFVSPNADFTAVYLLRHAQLHFLDEGIKIRHLLDWLFFLKAEAHKVDWPRVTAAMAEIGLIEFARIATAFCQHYLGWTPCEMPAAISDLPADDPLLAKFFDDVINPQPDGYDPRLHLKALRIVRRSARTFRFRRLLNESYFYKLWQSLLYNSVTGIRPKV